MKVVLGMSVYNEEDNMVTCLESFKGVVDAVHIVGGRFLGYPGERFSTDATVSVAKDWCDREGVELKVTEAADLRQPVKSSLYLQGLEEGDYVWTNAPDMTLQCDSKVKLRKDIEVRAARGDKFMAVKCDDSEFYGKPELYLKNVLIRAAPNLRWYPNHWTIYSGDALYCETHVARDPLDATVVNRPLSTRPFSRLMERAAFRALRLLMTEKDFETNLYEQGSENPAEYMDTRERLEEMVSTAVARLENDPTDFDTGVFSMLKWLQGGAFGPCPMLSEVDRGMVLGLLYALRVAPNFYK